MNEKEVKSAEVETHPKKAGMLSILAVLLTPS
jgi:hypothetical protein